MTSHWVQAVSHAQTVRVGLAQPQRDPRRLTRLLCERIETIAPGYGTEIMAQAAPIAEPLVPRQVSQLGMAAPDLSGQIDVPANRVGTRAVRERKVGKPNLHSAILSWLNTLSSIKSRIQK